MANERPSEELNVSLGTGFFVLAVIGGIFTFGVALLAVWMISLNYPARLEPDGLLTRGGKRHAWKDLEHTLQLQKGALRLVFAGGSVNVVPRFLAAPGEVLDYLRRCGVQTGVHMHRS